MTSNEEQADVTKDTPPGRFMEQNAGIWEDKFRQGESLPSELIQHICAVGRLHNQTGTPNNNVKIPHAKSCWGQAPE